VTASLDALGSGVRRPRHTHRGVRKRCVKRPVDHIYWSIARHGTEPVPPVSPDATATAPSPTTEPDPTTTASEQTSATSTPSSGDVATIDSELGRVSYTLPPGSFADPRPDNPLPDFVVGQARWIVPDCCNLGVTLQNLEPPMPDWELTDSFEANGVHWNLYDSGPRDGTLIIARGTAGPITVLVGTQSLSSDPPGNPMLPVAEAVVRSVVVDPTGAG